MLKKMFILMSLSISMNLYADTLKLDCNPKNLQQKNEISANYHVRQGAKEFDLTYWRTIGKSAYQYPNNGITELWQKEMKNQISLTRIFHRQKRSITYEPSDLTLLGKEVNSWQKKQNLLSPQLLEKGAKKTILKSENNCLLEKHKGTIHTDEIELIWNPQLKIVIKASIQNKISHRKMQYDLTGLSTYQKQVNFFKKVLSYDQMDYADIGDNEADPFIKSMINLGFVEHQETNIINEKGEQIHTSHHSVHQH